MDAGDEDDPAFDGFLRLASFSFALSQSFVPVVSRVFDLVVDNVRVLKASALCEKQETLRNGRVYAQSQRKEEETQSEQTSFDKTDDFSTSSSATKTKNTKTMTINNNNNNKASYLLSSSSVHLSLLSPLLLVLAVILHRVFRVNVFVDVLLLKTISLSLSLKQAKTNKTREQTNHYQSVFERVLR